MQAVARVGRLPKIVLTIAGLGVMAVAAAALLRPVPERSGLQPSRTAAKSKIGGGNWIGARAGDPDAWSGSERGQVVPLETARARADFRVPEPAYLPADVKYVQTYRISPAPNRPEREKVELRYSTGLWIIIARQKDGFDAWGLADHFNSPEVARTAIGDNPGPWLKVKVNGIPALGHESGTETQDGVTARTIAAYVGWWKDGIMYEVYDISGRPVSELLKVAESLK